MSKWAPERLRAYISQRRIAFKAAGLCAKCGKNPNGDYAECRQCRLRRSELREMALRGLAVNTAIPDTMLST